MPSDAKTTVSVLRDRPGEAAVVIDSARAGQMAAECTGVGGTIPVVDDGAAAAEAGADGLLIGVAPQVHATAADAVRATGLPATDPMRVGAGPLAEALAASRRDHAPAA